jgi:quercetin dioxygenase-like cupin family protein
LSYSGRFSQQSAETQLTSWGSLTWLVNSELVEGSELTLGVVTIKPGRSNPTHTHPNCEEIVYVLSGSCEQQIGEERTTLSAGQGVVVPRELEHCSVNTGSDPLVVLVCYSSADRETVFRGGPEAAY